LVANNPAASPLLPSFVENNILLSVGIESEHYAACAEASSSLSTTLAGPPSAHTPIGLSTAPVTNSPIASSSHLTFVNTNSHTPQHIEIEQHEPLHTFGIQAQLSSDIVGTLTDADANATLGKISPSVILSPILSPHTFSTGDINTDEVDHSAMSLSPWPAPTNFVSDPVGTPATDDRTLLKEQVPFHWQPPVWLSLRKPTSNKPHCPIVMASAPASAQHIPSTYTATPVTAYTTASPPFTRFHSQSLRDLTSPNFNSTDFNTSSATLSAHPAPLASVSTPIALPNTPTTKSPTAVSSQTTVIKFQPLAPHNFTFDEFSILPTSPLAPPLPVGPPITFQDTPAAESLAVSQQQTSFTEYQSTTANNNSANISIAPAAPSAPLSLSSLVDTSQAGSTAKSLAASSHQTSFINFQLSVCINLDFTKFSILLLVLAVLALLATPPINIPVKPTADTLIMSSPQSQLQSRSFTNQATFTLDSTKSNTLSLLPSASALLPSSSLASPVTFVTEDTIAAPLPSLLAESIRHTSDLVESECYYSPNLVCTQTHHSTSSIIIPVAETPANPSLQAAFAKIVGHTSDLIESECYYYSSAPFQDSGSPSVSKLLLKRELDTADSSSTTTPHHLI
jgi:hypothetical protein